MAQLIAAKEDTGKTFTQISQEVGLTNLYTAQLFYNQASAHFLESQVSKWCLADRCLCRMKAQLKPGTVDALRKAVPGLSDEHVSIMQRCPMRSFDPQLIQASLQQA